MWKFLWIAFLIIFWPIAIFIIVLTLVMIMAGG